MLNWISDFGFLVSLKYLERALFAAWYGVNPVNLPTYASAPGSCTLNDLTPGFSVSTFSFLGGAFFLSAFFSTFFFLPPASWTFGVFSNSTLTSTTSFLAVFDPVLTWLFLELTGLYIQYVYIIFLN